VEQTILREQKYPLTSNYWCFQVFVRERSRMKFAEEGTMNVFFVRRRDLAARSRAALRWIATQQQQQDS
jgi:hypothetical protein